MVLKSHHNIIELPREIHILILRLTPEQLNKNLRVGPNNCSLKKSSQLILTCKQGWYHCSNVNPYISVSSRKVYLPTFSKILRLSHLNSLYFFPSSPCKLICINTHSNPSLFSEMRTLVLSMPDCPTFFLKPFILILVSVCVSVFCFLSLCFSFYLLLTF